MSVTASDVLLRASQIIQQGWIQGVDHDENDTKHCARGAIDVAAEQLCPGHGYFLVEESRALLIRYLHREYGAWSNHAKSMALGITEWNDEKSRTAEDVALAMKCAAA